MNMYCSLRSSTKEAEDRQSSGLQDGKHDSLVGFASSDSPPSEKFETGALVATKQRRFTMSTEVRQFLEDVFNKQPCPNRKDRELIAKKCGITKLQVRVWVSQF